MTRLLALSALLFLVVDRPAAAADGSTLSLAKAFASICMLDAPDFEKVELTAKIKGWEQIEGPEHHGVLTRSSNPTRSSWKVTDAAVVPVAVTVTWTPVLSIHRLVSTCGVQASSVDTSDALRDITRILSLPAPLDTEVKGDRTVTSWQIEFAGRNIDVLLIVSASPQAKAAHQGDIIMSASIANGLPAD